MNVFTSAVIISCTLVLGVVGQIPSFGRCPNVKVQEDFKLSQYAGRWYEIERYWPLIFQLGTTCGQATYTDLGDGSIKVENKGYNTLSRKITNVTGEAHAPKAAEPSKLVVSFPDAGLFATGDYWVLSTDYSTYSIVYSCTDLWFMHLDIIWVVGREKSFSDELRTELHKKITDEGLRTNYLLPQDHENCPY